MGAKKSMEELAARGGGGDKVEESKSRKVEEPAGGRWNGIEPQRRRGEERKVADGAKAER